MLYKNSVEKGYSEQRNGRGKKERVILDTVVGRLILRSLDWPSSSSLTSQD